MSEMKIDAELTGISNCPHCGVSAPYFLRSHQAKLQGTNGQPARIWALYYCTSCGGGLLAKGATEKAGAPVLDLYPKVWEPDTDVPDRARRYLYQASKTLSSPDASVLMSASSIDAMLKEQGLKDGSLFKRIDQAVERGMLTSGMARWAHQTRIDANNPRHADDDTPQLSETDAARAFDFAKAIAEILYVLPKRMPN